jgi:hypothetical protein
MALRGQIQASVATTPGGIGHHPLTLHRYSPSMKLAEISSPTGKNFSPSLPDCTDLTEGSQALTVCPSGKSKVYECVSIILRTDAVKIINLTIKRV